MLQDSHWDGKIVQDSSRNVAVYVHFNGAPMAMKECTVHLLSNAKTWDACLSYYENANEIAPRSVKLGNVHGRVEMVRKFCGDGWGWV